METNSHIKARSKDPTLSFPLSAFGYRELDVLHSHTHSFIFARFRQPASLSFFRFFGIFPLLSAPGPILSGSRLYIEIASGLHGKIHSLDVILPIADFSAALFPGIVDACLGLSRSALSSASNNDSFTEGLYIHLCEYQMFLNRS